MGTKVAKVLITAVVLLAALAAGAVAVGAQTSSASAPGGGVAGLAVKQCYSDPCHGNARNEVIYERIGDHKSDLIRGYGGNDSLHAETYTADVDRVYGYGGGTDYIYVDDGDTLDAAVGGRGFDYCYVDASIEAAPSCDRVIFR